MSKTREEKIEIAQNLTAVRLFELYNRYTAWVDRLKDCPEDSNKKNVTEIQEVLSNEVIKRLMREELKRLEDEKEV